MWASQARVLFRCVDIGDLQECNEKHVNDQQVMAVVNGRLLQRSLEPMTRNIHDKDKNFR